MTIESVIGMSLLFLIKHFICDFLLQTGTIAMKKHHWQEIESYAHSAFHAIGAIAVLGIYSYSEYWYLGLLSGCIHYGIDYIKGNLVEENDLKPTDTYFWWLLGADQMFHCITYILIIKSLVFFDN